MTGPLSNILHSELVHFEGVSQFSPARRFAPIYRAASPADRVFFLAAGLVKIFNRAREGKEVIVDAVTPGELFGEDALIEGALRGSSAEVLQEATVFTVPVQVFFAFADSRHGFWPLVAASMAERQRALERKVEMLCVSDVETRILYYLRELSLRLKKEGQESDFTIPLSQSELASLVGATRETTSTTLNALARRGLVRLGRRLLTVPSLANLPPQPETVLTVAATGA